MGIKATAIAGGRFAGSYILDIMMINPAYMPNIPISGRAANKPTLELPPEPLANTTAIDENKTNSKDVRSINANICIFRFW